MKISRNNLIIATAVIVVTGAYTVGTHNGRSQSSTEKAADGASYSKSLESMRAERDKAENNFEAACYEYQKLYPAYNQLYAQFGAASGQAKVSPASSAKGNPDSCYGLPDGT